MTDGFLYSVPSDANVADGRLADPNSSGSTAYSMAADVGVFTLSGQDVSLLAGRALAADVGVFTLAGQAVSLLAGRALTADVGVFTLAGQAVSLLAGRALTADVGVFTLAGQAVSLLAGRALAADAGVFTLSGQNVDLLYSGAVAPVPTVLAASGGGSGEVRRRRRKIRRGEDDLAVAVPDGTASNVIEFDEARIAELTAAEMQRRAAALRAAEDLRQHDDEMTALAACLLALAA